ncbi:MAG: hypothetical protein AAF645_09925 [Myxococcota bacterium]
MVRAKDPFLTMLSGERDMGEGERFSMGVVRISFWQRAASVPTAAPIRSNPNTPTIVRVATLGA